MADRSLSPPAMASVVEEAGLTINETHVLPGVSPRVLSVPDALTPPLREHLRSLYPGGLYAHQSEAIDAAIAGSDLCLATSTASGKSLIFMSAAIHCLLTCDLCKVLALYPVRALIQDQLQKWTDILAPFGLKVGFIDGGVPTEYRGGILESSDVVLMTPDVTHAWMMSNLRSNSVTEFMAALQLLILDEAHVYDGAFGTHAAHLMRRIAAAARPFRLISSTATLGDAASFIERLAGRSVRVFGTESDGSGRQEMTVHLLHPVAKRPFDAMVSLLRGLSRTSGKPFLAFADSRKAVERLVAALRRDVDSSGGDASEDAPEGAAELTAETDDSSSFGDAVLPYRAGYETDDRHDIQRALSNGELRGVVSTSALELGLDIGDIGTVVLLSLPKTTKALWQRIGRGGRRVPGLCLILDSERKLASMGRSLSDFLGREPEPNWLYLDNRYIQFAHALCAARECADNGTLEVPEEFETLPAEFRQMLGNEIEPTESVSADLYPMKQRAEADPHHEFPLRSCSEQNFRIEGPNHRPLGTVDFRQAIREAYPGAIYHYLGRPYRVYQFRQRDGLIRAKKERYWTTQPQLQVMTFPAFRGGMLNLRASESGFLAEVELQVSERVVGVREQRGPTVIDLPYGPASSHSTRPINRFFRTTGMCWHVPQKPCHSEPIALAVREAFAMEFGLQEGDLGVGLFHSKSSPLGPGICQGACVYDVTHGSLRLTERLVGHFERVLNTAINLLAHREDTSLLLPLEQLHEESIKMAPRRITMEEHRAPSEGDWVEVIATGSPAIVHATSGQHETTVVGIRYTPQGLMYDLTPQTADSDRWSMTADHVQPIFGLSSRARFNLMTGEEVPDE